MAIRSNILRMGTPDPSGTAEMSSARPADGRRVAISVISFGCWIAGGVIVAAAVSGGRVPSVADVLLHLATLATAFVAMTLVAAWIEHERADAVLSRWVSVLPFAVMGSVIVAWTGVWNDGSGAVALPMRHAVLFFLTAGIAPLKLGPDVLLRAVTILSVLAFGYQAHTGNRIRQIRVAAAVWAAGAAVLLIPSWAASVLSLLSNSSAIITAQDALRLMGSRLSGSYWANFQQERFLTGIGDQLGVIVGFWTTAITFLVGTFLVAGYILIRDFTRARGQMAMMARSILTSTPAWAFLAAIGIGFLSSSANPMRFLQLMPTLLLSVALVALAWRLLFGSTIALLVSAGASFLLGWPVFASHLIAVALCIAAGKESHAARRAGMLGAAGIAFTSLGGAFGSWSSMFPPSLITWGLSMGVLIAGIHLLRPFARSAAPSMRELAGFVGVLLLCAMFMGFSTGIAIAALAGLAAFALQKKVDLWEKYASPLLLLAGWAMTGLKLFLGR